MAVDFRKIALSSLYLYIASLYTLAYDARLNLISKALFVFTIGFFCLHLITNPRINRGKIYGFFIVYTLYSTASCFWSTDFAIAFSRNISLYQILLLVFMIYNLIENVQEIEGVFIGIFWGTMIMCGQTILKYGLGTVINMMAKGKRLGTEINQANAFGYYCVIAFIIGIYNVLYKKKKIYLLWAMVPFVFSFASGSRKSIVVIIAATALIFALRNGKIRLSRILIALAVCVALFAILYNIEGLQPFFKRFTAMLEMFDSGDMGKGDNSIASRVNMIEFGMDLFKKNFLFGYGTEQYNVLYEMEYGVMRPAHNNYIQYLVSFGVVGTSVFYGMYAYILAKTYKNIKKKDLIAIFIFVIIIVELINHLTTGVFLNKFAHIYLALAFAYCNLAEKNENEKEEQKELVEEFSEKSK